MTVPLDAASVSTSAVAAPCQHLIMPSDDYAQFFHVMLNTNIPESPHGLVAAPVRPLQIHRLRCCQGSGLANLQTMFWNIWLSLVL